MKAKRLLKSTERGRELLTVDYLSDMLTCLIDLVNAQEKTNDLLSQILNEETEKETIHGI
jgi:hypothetical protein